MPASTKLYTAVKALCYLARDTEQSFNSSEISVAIGVNASKLRKLLALLAKNKIVRSEKGSNGGFRLIRRPQFIHLQEIYCAIEDQKAFHLNVRRMEDRNRHNRLSVAVNDYLLNLFAEIQVEIEDKMSKIFLADIIQKTNVRKSL